MVVFPDEVRVTRSLRKTLRKHHYEVRLDHDFAAVIRACAAPRAGRRHLDHPAIQAAYIRMHELGYAHSVETWIDGELAGGLYGMAIGRAFYGESMFSRRTDASKIAFAHLVRFLEHDFRVLDCQMTTRHLAPSAAGRSPRSLRPHARRADPRRPPAGPLAAGRSPSPWT
jgi:leucyl/phenylalanyl-tRNA--protein transferase